jgi:transcriptional regulator with XRE-family HTH domain
MSSLTIGEALIARRNQLGLDKGRAADQIGMSRTTYGAYEANRQRPSVNVFPALAEFLDVDMEYFLELYGATMILAARPALQQVLATPDGADELAPPADEASMPAQSPISPEVEEPGEVEEPEQPEEFEEFERPEEPEEPEEVAATGAPTGPEESPKRKKEAKRTKKRKKKH